MAEEQPLGLHNLPRPRGATKAPKRKGRGHGSGLGKTAGKGHKGQNARSGGGVRLGFEGGQMPLIRRVPKRGFHNLFRVEHQVVNLDSLEKLKGTDVSPVTLLASGLASSKTKPIKILGRGDASRAYVVSGCAISKTAREKIDQAGGKVEGA